MCVVQKYIIIPSFFFLFLIIKGSSLPLRCHVSLFFFLRKGLVYLNENGVFMLIHVDWHWFLFLFHQVIPAFNCTYRRRNSNIYFPKKKMFLFGVFNYVLWDLFWFMEKGCWLVRNVSLLIKQVVDILNASTKDPLIVWWRECLVSKNIEVWKQMICHLPLVVFFY